MAELVAAALVLSLTAYAVLGGADFGAAVVQPLLPHADRHRVDAAIAPVWEANHVWLVLAVVLTFVGFPPVYVALSTYLHVPLSLVLVGIVGRGAAFTFRHYDPQPGALRPLYTWMFRLSSLLAPFFLGVTLAAVAAGGLVTDLERGFVAVFIAPWLSPFCVATGCFVVCLFSLIGAVLLAAEHPEQGRLPYLALARNTQLVTIASGALVFAAAAYDQVPLWHAVTRPGPVLLMVLVATVFVPVLAWGFHRGAPTVVRLALGGQVLAVLSGFWIAGAPALVRFADAPPLTLQSAAAPDATLLTLLIALAVGLCLIVPALVALMLIYKRR